MKLTTEQVQQISGMIIDVIKAAKKDGVTKDNLKDQVAVMARNQCSVELTGRNFQGCLLALGIGKEDCPFLFDPERKIFYWTNSISPSRKRTVLAVIAKVRAENRLREQQQSGKKSKGKKNTPRKKPPQKQPVLKASTQDVVLLSKLGELFPESEEQITRIIELYSLGRTFREISQMSITTLMTFFLESNVKGLTIREVLEMFKNSRKKS